jgi:hypothetical protein
VILAGATLRYSTPTVAPEQMAQTTFGERLHPPSGATSWHKMVLHKKWPSIQAGGLGEIWYDDVPQTLTDGMTRIHMRTLKAGYSARVHQDICTAVMPSAVLLSFTLTGFAAGGRTSQWTTESAT